MFTQRIAEAPRAPAEVLRILKREVTLDIIYGVGLLICRIALLGPDTGLRQQLKVVEEILKENNDAPPLCVVG